MNFLSFSTDYWDGPRHNRHYFCAELSRRHPVLFASPPFNADPVIRNLGKSRLSRSGVHEVSPTLINHVPSKFLFTNDRFPTVNRWMRDLRVDSVRRTLARYRLNDPVLLVWHPHFRDMIGEFRERLVVYYAYDQLTGYTGGSGKPSPEEQALMAKADIVFVLSRELYEQKKSQAARVVHLANAVDFDMFSRSRDHATIVPEDVASIPGPRIGYIGTMNEKLNVRVLEHVASRHPEWSIVLIGRENYRDVDEKRRFLDLAARPNVHWLPYKPPEQVPACIKGLDVCLMSYVINGWTFYGDPSKLHEYLASGKPTIGSGLSSIRDFSDVVAVADAPEEWVAAIEAGLRESGDEMPRRRIETARNNSYVARVDKFLATIRELLND